jgi:hypothetical protein
MVETPIAQPVFPAGVAIRQLRNVFLVPGM